MQSSAQISLLTFLRAEWRNISKEALSLGMKPTAAFHGEGRLDCEPITPCLLSHPWLN